jgi:hypothetical protein
MGKKDASPPAPGSGSSTPPSDDKDAVTTDEKKTGAGKTTDGDGSEEERNLCPQCGAKFVIANIRTINPSEDEEEKMQAAMEAARAAETSSKPKGKKRKADKSGSSSDPAPSAPAVDGTNPPAKKSKSTPSATEPTVALGASTIAGASRALAASLALEEAKRKKGMSEAVKSLYATKDNGRKETWATKGTFTRVSSVTSYFFARMGRFANPALVVCVKGLLSGI